MKVLLLSICLECYEQGIIEMLKKTNYDKALSWAENDTEVCAKNYYIIDRQNIPFAERTLTSEEGDIMFVYIKNV